MTKIISIGLSVVVAGMLVGCTKDDSTSNNDSSVSKAEITTKTEAKNAKAAISLGNPGAVSQPKTAAKRAASLAAINETGSCTNGGTWTMAGDSTETSQDMTYTYDKCAEDYGTMNGVEKWKMDQVDSKYVGSAEEINFSYKNTDEETTSNTKSTFTMVMSGEDFSSYTGTTDGKTEYKYNDDSGEYGYKAFKVSFDDNAIRLDGEFSVKSSKYSCADGTYTLKTIDPLYEDPNDEDYLSSGTIEINGVKYEMNSDHTMTVTFADGKTETIDQDTEVTCD